MRTVKRTVKSILVALVLAVVMGVTPAVAQTSVGLCGDFWEWLVQNGGYCFEIHEVLPGVYAMFCNIQGGIGAWIYCYVV